MNKTFTEAKTKLKSRRGFTLAEALVATIILLLVSAVVAAGIPAAIRAYDRVVIASNAEVLLSTSMSALRNELGTAKDISVNSSSDTITYYNENRESMSKIMGGDSRPDIMIAKRAADGVIIKEEDIPEADRAAFTPERLVSESASDTDKELHITFGSVSYDEDDGVVTFRGLTARRKDGSATPAVRNEYSVRIISQSDE